MAKPTKADLQKSLDFYKAEVEKLAKTVQRQQRELFTLQSKETSKARVEIEQLCERLRQAEDVRDKKAQEAYVALMKLAQRNKIIRRMTETIMDMAEEL